MDNASNTNTPKAERLTSLDAGEIGTHFNPRYSRIIRRVALILPIIALMLLITIFNWNSFKDDAITPIQEEAQAVMQQTIGKNELLNPKFESVDDNGQPFTITARRATQSEKDEDLLVLEIPDAALALKDGGEVTLSAIDGTYGQEAQKVFLQNNVVLTHHEKDSLRGYEMNMQELHIDMAASAAWSDVDVSAQGPAGTLTAKGMKASSPNETLIFTGPAKLVLTLDSGLDLGRLSP